MNSSPSVSLGVSAQEKAFEDSSAVDPNWQVDQLIGANPVTSVNLALMMGMVVGWLIKRR